jgi:hypothetical protein
MLCKMCRDGLEGIWGPSRTKRVCRRSEWTGGDWEAQQCDAEPEEIIAPANDSSSGEGGLHDPRAWMFDHHTTEESFGKSIQDGCVQCNSFAFLRKAEKANPVLARLGWFSIVLCPSRPSLSLGHVCVRPWCI